MGSKRYLPICLPVLTAAFFLGGCAEIVLFQPRGPVGASERTLIIVALLLMAIVVIPVFIMTFRFSRKYRASNTNAPYAPRWSYSATIDAIVWLVPVCIIMALGYLSWTRTHSLDPHKPIEPGVRPVIIEAVSLDWKWLFIYPQYDIAAVNRLVFPANVPLSFRITSDTVLTSFFIPQLGSQIYAMTGKQTLLHLMADRPGVYDGHNQQFSGAGYPEMHFKAIAVPGQEFDAWVQKTRQAQGRLDPARFRELEKPTMGYPVTYFSSVEHGMFDYVLEKNSRPPAVGPDRARTDKGS